MLSEAGISYLTIKHVFDILTPKIRISAEKNVLKFNVETSTVQLSEQKRHLPKNLSIFVDVSPIFEKYPSKPAEDDETYSVIEHSISTKMV